MTTVRATGAGGVVVKRMVGAAMRGAAAACLFNNVGGIVNAPIARGGLVVALIRLLS